MILDAWDKLSSYYVVGLVLCIYCTVHHLFENERFNGFSLSVFVLLFQSKNLRNQWSDNIEKDKLQFYQI